MRKEEKGKKRTHDSPSSAHSFSFSLAVPFLRFKGLWGVTVWEAWTKWKEMKSDKWEKRSHALFICFTSVHSSHGGRQSRVLCSCCVLCYRFIVMDWAKWGKHEWTGNKDHTTATNEVKDEESMRSLLSTYLSSSYSLRSFFTLHSTYPDMREETRQ